MPHKHTAVVESNRTRLQRFVRVRSTHVGQGVFAARRLRAGVVIGEIEGDVLDRHPDDPSYCMELPSGRVLEPAAPLRFLNHSCDPNCELFYWSHDDQSLQEDRLWLQTTRAVEPGEELSIDYCWPADAAIPCRCGTAACRGWIVDPAELHLLTARPDGGGQSSPPSPSA
ncbi:MAG: SET domain-containing protein [Planctomycetia bacterium]|nr:SET domain-containing protein [Planctomycetia bacterium]